MRLCVPTEGEEGLAARLSDQFGRAPAFTVVDTMSPAVETFLNPERRRDHGRCAVATYLADRNVEAVASREIGRNSLESLSALGIAVYKTAGLTVREVLDEARSSRLERVDGPAR
jgi:predicted Fe-Mo cluster-binding NifX family protein